MSISKTAVILGITVMAMIGAMTYMNSDRLYNLRGSDHELRVALFKDWAREFNRSYGVGESEMRFKLWSKTYDFVQKHNAKGDETWEAGLNQFSDLSTEEWSSLHLGFKYDPDRPRTNVVILDEVEETGPTPGSVDWRKKGAVTAIKDQGSCGSCWTFSSTGALEGLHQINKKELLVFSEQQLLDCTKSYGTQGCQGGFMVPCFKYVKDKGIMLGSDYKYEGKVGQCRAKSGGFMIKSYVEVKKNDAAQLKAAVTKQPVAVAVAAEKNWQSYKSGIMTDCDTKLDHAVLAVGYEKDYWFVKNSWGTKWGESGYIRVQRGQQNNGEGVCGINMENSYPTL